MAHTPKLEVFTITLKTSRNDLSLFSFKAFLNDLLIKREVITEEEDDENILFLEFFRFFVSQFSSGEYIKNEKDKKAMTAFRADVDHDDCDITPHAEHCIIEGKLYGGKYGLLRTRSKVNDKTQQDRVREDDVIADQFYFFLHMPMDSHKGILMVQSYTSESITALLKTTIKGLFSNVPNYLLPEIQAFCPKLFQDQFKNGGFIKKYAFSGEVLTEDLDFPVEHTNDVLKVSITIESERGIEYREHPTLIRKIISNKIGEKFLGSFSKKKAFIKNNSTNRVSPFDINDEDFKIKPVIMLEDHGITVDEFGFPDYTELKGFCFSLLNIVHEELSLLNQISED
ncbi:MAG: hypothetical protein EGP82_10750 [Odoribacter splanchnicus]|nr:hypothetical protein [Odoribacter splanchnicus]